MLIYIGDTLVETDNIEFIRTNGEGDEKSLVLVLKGREPLVLHNPQAADEFEFAMSIGSSLNIVNTAELAKDRDQILLHREMQRQQQTKNAQAIKETEEEAAIAAWQQAAAQNVNLGSTEQQGEQQPIGAPPPSGMANSLRVMPPKTEN